METIKLNSHVGADGILQIQMPTNLKEKDVEVVIVIQSLENKAKLADKSEYTEKQPKISEIIAGFRQLRREIPSDESSIREMIEEGRRF
ncbi:MAG: hypothetical protein RLZZ574_702 [Cyanobacteriota bacterium]|jgi:hypothetical protein